MAHRDPALSLRPRKKVEARIREEAQRGAAVLLTTHDMWEADELSHRVAFINEGQIILNASMDSLSEDYVELLTSGEKADEARRIGPITERDIFGKKVMLFEKPDRERLITLGELHTPSVADLFVAMMKGAK